MVVARSPIALSLLALSCALGVGTLPAKGRKADQSSQAACATIAQDAAITEIGAFSDMQYTAEHEYGHIVLLWRAGSCVFGLLEANQGLQGDTPLGELLNVTHNASTGELSFAAKLTLGATGRLGAMEPTHDRIAFTGTITPAKMSGTLEHFVENAVNAKPERVPAMLSASPSDADQMHGPATYKAWRERWDPILRVRGPKW